MEQEKKCNHCEQIKPFSAFGKGRDRYGLLYDCKQCRAKKFRDKYKENPEKMREIKNRSRNKNIEQAREYDKQQRNKHKEKRNAHSREYGIKWREENKELKAFLDKEYYKKEKENIKSKRMKRYYSTEDKTLIREYAKRYQKDRNKIDINFKLACNLRGRLYHAIVGNFKSGSAVKDLGISIPEFKEFIEDKFISGMTWDNYGEKWHLDHIKPLVSFDLSCKDDFLQAANYTNYQPLFGPENIKKGSTFEGIKYKREKYKAKPFLRWMGSKRLILPQILKRMPEKYEHYYEPFIGGGSLFFALGPAKAYIQDINKALIVTYRAVKNSVDEVISNLVEHEKKHSEQYFTEIKESLLTETDENKVASMFIYLNKTCYGGIYGVLKTGKLATPMSSDPNPFIVDSRTLRNASKLLQDTTICAGSFENIDLQKDAFYYLDPPYHETRNRYDIEEFGEDKQIKLKEMCDKITSIESKFLLSNSNTSFIRDLYKEYIIKEIESPQILTYEGKKNSIRTELLISNY